MSLAPPCYATAIDVGGGFLVALALAALKSWLWPEMMFLQRLAAK